MNAFLERGIPEFRCTEGTRLRFPAHLHRHVELVLFRSGRAVAYADGERCELAAGDVFIAFPNQVHSYDPPTGEERYYVLIVEPELMAELQEILFHSVPKSAVLRGAVDEEMLSLARRLRELKAAHTVLEQTERRALLLLLFGKILSRCELVHSNAEASSAFKSVINYCTQNYEKELTLSVLERELHISKYYISHLFAERMRLGFNDYINSLRVSHACRLLRHAEQGVTAVGAAVGFSTTRTFNRAFLKEMGMTPSEYRTLKKGEKQ